MSEDNSQHDGAAGESTAPVEGDGGAPEVSADDRVKNMQAEMYRKLENITKATDQRFEQLLQTLNQRQPAQPAAPEKSMKELIFDDPDRAMAIMEERATARATQTVTQQVQLSQQTQLAVADIQSKYPEFAQEGSEAAKLAVEKARNLPRHLVGTPEGAKMVMLETAAELGLTPAKARRQASNPDDFSNPGASGTPRTAARKGNDVSKDVHPDTIAFAQLLGVDVNDPKRMAGLAQASKRKAWNRYG